ncbi:unnamed protein product [Thelazia callipaeda]|uniref:C2H2-type domain-containing protein n=1 Tax=Thelazia callipaeda TaxID=103827 RepID=A0A0N5D465_THECL|nr:unnamed protein product [Thelazia callipaeda]
MSVKPSICGEYGKCFIQACTLEKHQRIYIGEKPFMFYQCGRYFSLSENLKRHEEIQAVGKSYQCESLCSGNADDRAPEVEIGYQRRVDDKYSNQQEQSGTHDGDQNNIQANETDSVADAGSAIVQMLIR